jgi:hypothetical protein
MSQQQAKELQEQAVKQWEALKEFHKHKQSLFEGSAPKRCTSSY